MAHYCEHCGSVIEDEHSTVEFGDIRLCRDVLKLCCGSKVTKVTRREADVLADLMKGRVVSKEAMMMRHFPEATSDNLPSIYVMRLRQKLEQVRSGLRIEPVFGQGYHLMEYHA